MWGWRQGGVVDSDPEVMGVLCQGFRADEHEVRFIVFELEEVGLHPGLNISVAIGQGGGYSCGDGFGRDVDLDIIGVAVEVKTMFVYDISEWQDAKEEKREDQALNLGGRLVTEEQLLMCMNCCLLVR